jgi:hypothetical protein
VAINDYDVLVIGGDTDTARLRTVVEALPAALDVDFVDVAAVPSLAAVSPSQEAFDLRAGRVISGDPCALDRLPALCPAELTGADALVQLGNRVGGVLMAARRAAWATGDTRDEFLVGQVAKLATAVGDAHLIRWRDYSAMVATRAPRFRALARAALLDRELADLVIMAYEYKLRPGRAPAPDPHAALPCLARGLPRLLALLVDGGAAAGSPQSAAMDAAGILAQRLGPSDADGDRRLEILTPGLGRAATFSRRARVYLALWALFLAEHGACASDRSAWAALAGSALPLPEDGPFTGTGEGLLGHRQTLALDAWNRLIH